MVTNWKMLSIISFMKRVGTFNGTGEPCVDSFIIQFNLRPALENDLPSLITFVECHHIVQVSTRNRKGDYEKCLNENCLSEHCQLY